MTEIDYGRLGLFFGTLIALAVGTIVAVLTTDVNIWSIGFFYR